MSHEEAVEYYYYNIIGGHFGTTKPDFYPRYFGVMVLFPYICIDKKDINMTTHEISDYFREAYNMENVYKTEKHIGRLIRSHRFSY